MANIKSAIMKAKLEGILYEILVKTNCDNVVFNKEGTEVTLTSYLAEIMATIATLDTTAAREAAVTALKQEMLGDTPVEAYNTFTELAAYIEEHKDVATALTAAIGEKADASALTDAVARIAALETKKVAEADLDTALAEKVNAAAEGNHSHSNKTVLDGITEEKVTGWDDAATKAHEHANKDVLDGITAEKVANWDKTKVYVQAEEPSDMADGDIWLQIVE